MRACPDTPITNGIPGSARCLGSRSSGCRTLALREPFASSRGRNRDGAGYLVDRLNLDNLVLDAGKSTQKFGLVCSHVEAYRPGWIFARGHRAL